MENGGQHLSPADELSLDLSTVKDQKQRQQVICSFSPLKTSYKSLRKMKFNKNYYNSGLELKQKTRAHLAKGKPQFAPPCSKSINK